MSAPELSDSSHGDAPAPSETTSQQQADATTSHAPPVDTTDASEARAPKSTTEPSTTEPSSALAPALLTAPGTTTARGTTPGVAAPDAHGGVRFPDATVREPATTAPDVRFPDASVGEPGITTPGASGGVTYPDASVRDPAVEAADRERRRIVIGLFERLRVESEHSDGYDRDALEVGWLYSDGESTRDRVLAAERLTDGTWLSAYDAVTVLDASDLDVDHMVPLAEAWRSGGHQWPIDTWTSYANDLGDPRSLIAVSSSTNRSKGARDPAQWWPPEAAYRCQYAADWVAVKTRWQLNVDTAERQALDSQLESCTGAEIDFAAPTSALVARSAAEAEPPEPPAPPTTSAPPPP